VLTGLSLLGVVGIASVCSAESPWRRPAPVRPPYRFSVESVDGAPLPSFVHGGRRYVLGEPGARYNVRISNPSAERVEAVLSVDDAGVFKVDPRTYALVESKCGVKPGKVCFLSSNCWDAHGAAHFGFATVWVNRARAPDDNLPGKTVATIDDLSHLPSLLGVS
jgi:hypothetical protein